VVNANAYFIDFDNLLLIDFIHPPTVVDRQMKLNRKNHFAAQIKQLAE